MEIGIGLPSVVHGVDRRGIVDWARRAEAAGFSSLEVIDRIAYDNYESLVTLAAAAAVTERIRLATDILIAPLRANTALLAKQAATIDHLSGGRLVLGLAVGGRPDDYGASQIEFGDRGRRFERQLRELNELWSGDVVGPKPARGKPPTLLIGGSADIAFRRAAEHADGWTMGGGAPDQFAASLTKLRQAWSAAGREGQPRTMVLCYFALGDGAEQAARESLSHYYAFLGDYAEQIVASAATDAETVKAYVSAFAQAGVDELICFPTSTDLAQVELLAAAAGM